MIPYERKLKILALLEQEKVVSLNDAVRKLDIAKSTLRRDISELEQTNQLIKTRGGFSLPESQLKASAAASDAVSLKAVDNLAEKQRIAQIAVSYIHPHNTVFLDSGTTTFEVANILKDYQFPLYVASNDLRSSMVLSENDLIETIVIGGKLNTRNYSMNGFFSDSIISQMHADIAFIATDAVSIDKGLMCNIIDNVTGKKAIIDSAYESILLCDHTKFSKSSFITYCGFDQIDKVITGKELSPEILNKLRELGVEVILA